MGFRFRRTFKIAPGVHVNLSKGGISTSIGGPGASVNIRGDNVRQTVGLPGTGLSYAQQQRLPGAGGKAILVLVAVAVLFLWLFR
jgi:hypothetical protein